MNAERNAMTEDGEKFPLVTVADGVVVDRGPRIGARRPAALGGDAHQQAPNTC